MYSKTALEGREAVLFSGGSNFFSHSFSDVIVFKSNLHTKTSIFLTHSELNLNPLLSNVVLSRFL